MEALISQFTFLSDQALHDKNFDPSTIEDLTKLFEIEAYKSWAAMELQLQNEAQDAEIAMHQAEDYLDSIMDDTMDEFRRFEDEFVRMAEAELQELVDKSEKVRQMGSLIEKAAAVPSKRYMESWAAMELQLQNEAQDAEIAMHRAEDYLDSVMDDTMDEFRRFEDEFDRMAEAELQELVDKSEKVRKMGSLMEKAAAVASKRYMEAAMNSATVSMRSAWKAISSSKVHPS